MISGKRILLGGSDPKIILVQLGKQLSLTGASVYMGSRRYDRFIYDIANVMPDVVFISNISDTSIANELLAKRMLFPKTPFFIFTTCRKDIYADMTRTVRPDFYIVMEPLDMPVIRDIIMQRI